MPARQVLPWISELSRHAWRSLLRLVSEASSGSARVLLMRAGSRSATFAVRYPAQQPAGGANAGLVVPLDELVLARVGTIIGIKDTTAAAPLNGEIPSHYPTIMEQVADFTGPGTGSGWCC